MQLPQAAAQQGVFVSFKLNADCLLITNMRPLTHYRRCRRALTHYTVTVLPAKYATLQVFATL